MDTTASLHAKMYGHLVSSDPTSALTIVVFPCSVSRENSCIDPCIIFPFGLSAGAALPPGTRYLKIDVRHPAVVRHQKVANENRLKEQRRGVQREQGGSIRRPPSRLYEQLRRSLSSLEPVDLLCSTSPPEDFQDDNQADAVVGMTKEVQLTLRASGSPNAACNVVQLQCHLSEYRGGVVDMTEEAVLAANNASSGDILMISEPPTSQTPDCLVLPDWQKLSLAVASVGPRRRSPSPGEGVAAVVVRQRGHQNSLKSRASRVPSQARAQKSDSSATSRRPSCSELGDSVSISRQCPPIRPDYLEALQLLHERQRQWRTRKSQQRDKDTHPTPENASHTEEALQLAAPPPFRALPPEESLFCQITEFLGCLGMNMPEGCDWLREADPTDDPHSIGVASLSGGLIHSEAVQSVAESLYRWVCKGDSRGWAAISVVGVAETAAAYTEQPHGSDISGESTLHLILNSCGQHQTSGILLQTIDACDATTSMP
ncbi:hypothetical protein, conserved [Eimeria brunetti]|uniref:Uncharacterized protein n=1 Tax=Eimeria brunetti TaxID=51314 RepID=U6LV24_9EIME|nr:hypothetical protein, conserved [Eimeria brunetti]